MTTPEENLSAKRAVGASFKAPDDTAAEELHIPEQYKGRTSEELEWKFSNPTLYVNPEQNAAARRREAEILAAVKKQETAREQGKQRMVGERYSKLPDTQKTEFPSAQREINNQIRDFITQDKDMAGLSREETFLLHKLHGAWKQLPEEQKGQFFQRFAENFTGHVDNQVYENLVNRLAFDVLRARGKASDDAEADKIREKIGIPTTAAKEAPKSAEAKAEKSAENNYERWADEIPIDENKPKEMYVNIAVGNTFNDNDEQLLGGRVILADIYGSLTNRESARHTPEEILKIGKVTREDFQNYVTELNTRLKDGGKKEFTFGFKRKAGETGFHFNDSDKAAADHIFYFDKSSKDWKNPDANITRAYISMNPKEAEAVQRHFVDLCQKLYENGVDFTGKAASPNGLETRADNMVMYIADYDKDRAGKIIADFVKEKRIGQGYVKAAEPDPTQEGLSWAPEPTEAEMKLWQKVSGSTRNASYNVVVATKIAPYYLKRLAEAHQKKGNAEAANKFLMEAERVQNLIDETYKK